MKSFIYFQTSYDVVLSAFSLIELPNRKARLETLANLWARCSGYLILIELGTNTGFKLIHEARKFITNLKEEGQGDGYIFAPVRSNIFSSSISFINLPYLIQVSS